MYIFKYIQDPNSQYDTIDVTIKTEVETCKEIVNAFRRYLLACGFAEKTVDEHLGEE
jgi:hypothetical protein